jgi:hypothetical protein
MPLQMPSSSPTVCKLAKGVYINDALYSGCDYATEIACPHVALNAWTEVKTRVPTIWACRQGHCRFRHVNDPRNAARARSIFAAITPTGSTPAASDSRSDTLLTST